MSLHSKDTLCPRQIHNQSNFLLILAIYTNEFLYFLKIKSIFKGVYKISSDTISYDTTLKNKKEKGVLFFTSRLLLLFLLVITLLVCQCFPIRILLLRVHLLLLVSMTGLLKAPLKEEAHLIPTIVIL